MATPVWPSSINSFAEKGSWAFSPATDNIRTDYDQGPARSRRRFTRSLSTITFSIKMTYVEFEVFKTFVDVDLYQGAAWFRMPVFLGGDYVVSTIRFVDPKSPYSATEDGFDTIQVNFTAETLGNGVILSAGAAFLVNEWGAEMTASFADRLQILVNTQYPQIWN